MDSQGEQTSNNVSEEVEEVQERFICPYVHCDKTFPNSQSLAGHCRLHSFRNEQYKPGRPRKSQRARRAQAAQQQQQQQAQQQNEEPIMAVPLRQFNPASVQRRENASQILSRLLSVQRSSNSSPPIILRNVQHHHHHIHLPTPFSRPQLPFLSSSVNFNQNQNSFTGLNGLNREAERMVRATRPLFSVASSGGVSSVQDNGVRSVEELDLTLRLGR